MRALRYGRVFGLLALCLAAGCGGGTATAPKAPTVKPKATAQPKATTPPATKPPAENSMDGGATGRETKIGEVPLGGMSIIRLHGGNSDAAAGEVAPSATKPAPPTAKPPASPVPSSR